MKRDFDNITEILEDVKNVDIVKYAELLILHDQAKTQKEIAHRLLELEKVLEGGIFINA